MIYFNQCIETSTNILFAFAKLCAKTISHGRGATSPQYILLKFLTDSFVTPTK